MLIDRIIKYLWNYYNLSNNDTEHMQALKDDIEAFIIFSNEVLRGKENDK